MQELCVMGVVQCLMRIKALMNLIKSPVRIGSPSSGDSGRLAVAPNHVVLHVVTPHSRVTTDGALVRLFPCVTSDVTP